MTATLILLFFSLTKTAGSLEIVYRVTLQIQIERSSIKAKTMRKMVMDWIFLRTRTKQAYHSRYVNSRSKHSVSYVVAFEVLCKLIRNPNNVVGIVAELRVVSTMIHGFQQDLFIFSSTVMSTPDLQPKFTAVQCVKDLYSRAKATWN